MTTSIQRKAKQTPQAKCWCFTINNPTAPIQWNEATMSYLVYGKEVGKEGTPHHQGFVIFKKQKRLSNMKDINGQAHWEIKSSKSTYKQASDYCKKDGDFVEYGTLPEENYTKAGPKGNEANKAKWREINDKAKEGDLDWIDENHPKVFNQSYKNLKQMKVDYMKRKPNLPDVCGIWFHGASGVGKTHLITELYPNAYLKRAQNKWFDAYQQEEVIVIDDLDDTHDYMGYELKKLADKYCYMVEVKNSSMYIRPKLCVVTSQYTIDEIWKKDRKTADALNRRFKSIEVTKQNRAMLLSSMKEVKDNSKDTILDDDVTEEQFDQLMIEAEQMKYENAKTLGQKIQKQNRDIAMKKVDISKLPKKLRPTNEYFPDKVLQFPVPPVTKPVMCPKLERRNAMTTPPQIKPTVVPPPAPKRLKKEPKIIEISDDDEEVTEKLEESSEDSNLIGPDPYDDYYRYHTLNELYADELLEDSEPEEIESFSDEY